MAKIGKYDDAKYTAAVNEAAKQTLAMAVADYAEDGPEEVAHYAEEYAATTYQDILTELRRLDRQRRGK